MIDWEVLRNEHNIAGDNLKLELWALAMADSEL
jgi:hypothetical protein